MVATMGNLTLLFLDCSQLDTVKKFSINFYLALLSSVSND